jgi:hypothetical protein
MPGDDGQRMKRIIAAALPVLCLTLAAVPAFAQEAIRTGDGGAPPVGAPADTTATQEDPEALRAWAQHVLNAAAANPDAKPAGPAASCATAKTDDKPHGEVWAGAGTHGYRQAGGVVTQPLGACGSLTLMVDHTEASYGRSAPKAR